MKQRAPKRPAEERKRMILESAQRVFAEAGYANAGTEEVARGAGVAPSAIYRYFPSKKELYLAALRDSGDQLLGMWEEAAAMGGEPLQTLWQIGMNYYDHLQTRSDSARFFFQALGDTSDDDVRDAIAGNFTAMIDLLAARLAEGQAGGMVRDDLDPRVAALHFLAIGFSFELVSILRLDNELDRARVEAWGHLYIDSIREGANGADRGKHGEPGGSLPVRQPRRESNTGGGGNPLPTVPADPPHPLGAGGEQMASP